MGFSIDVEYMGLLWVYRIWDYYGFRVYGVYYGYIEYGTIMDIEYMCLLWM